VSDPLSLEWRGPVAVVTLCDGESIDADSIARLDAALDRVLLRQEGDCALVVAGGDCSSWNGLLASDAATRSGLFPRLCALLARLVALPVPTVAAVSGPCPAASATLATAFDYRVMRGDGGWLCLADADLGASTHPAILALLRAKLPPASLRDALLTGRRFDAEAARAARLVDDVAVGDGVVRRAVEIAEPLSRKDRRTFAAMKAALYGEVRDTLAREGRR